MGGGGDIYQLPTVRHPPLLAAASSCHRRLRRPPSSVAATFKIHHPSLPLNADPRFDWCVSFCHHRLAVVCRRRRENAAAIKRLCGPTTQATMQAY